MTRAAARGKPVVNPALQINPKVATATLAGAGSILLVWLIGLTGADVPPEAAASLTTVLAAAVGYLTPAPQGPPVAQDWTASAEPADPVSGD